MFERFGTLVDCFLKKNDNGTAFAFVEFERQDQVDTAIEKLNGHKVARKMIWVKYAKPKPKKEGGREGHGGRDGGGRGRDGFRGRNDGNDGGKRRFD